MKRAVKNKRFEKSGHKRARGKRMRKKNEGGKSDVESKGKSEQNKKEMEPKEHRKKSEGAIRHSALAPADPCMVWPGKCRPAAAFTLCVL